LVVVYDGNVVDARTLQRAALATMADRAADVLPSRRIIRYRWRCYESREMHRASDPITSRSSRGRRAALGALLVAAGLASHPGAARANGRYPKADQLVISVDRPDFMVARTTFGFLISNDAGEHWDWVCERAIGYTGVQDPTLGLLENGTIIASLSEGISRSTDLGCNWGFAEADLNDSPVIDLTVRKDQPSSALALLWDAQTVSYSSRFLQTDDNGRTFVPYGNPIDPSVLVSTLDTAPTDPHRAYASGTRSTGGVRAGLFFASKDDGQQWTEYAVPFDPKLEQGVYIAAVDPQHADTVYLRTNSATVSRLMVSHDAGQHFDVVYSGSLLAFALSPDGSRLYFGGEDGLHTGLASDLQFEQRSSLRLLCLAAADSTVYACSDEHSGFTIGASTDDGSTFTPLLHLKTVNGPLSCGSNDAEAECEQDWPLVSAQLGIMTPDETGDAGAGGAAATPVDAGLERGTPRAAATHSASCSIAAPGASSQLGVALLAALAAALRWGRPYKSRSRSRPRAR
jgi:hypothetical protein